MSEVEKGLENKEILTPSTDSSKDGNEKFDPEEFKRMLEELKQKLEAEENFGNKEFLDYDDYKINESPETDKIYPEDKKIFIEELPKKQFIDFHQNIKDKEIIDSQLIKILDSKISEIEKILDDLETRKNLIEGKADELSFQGNIDNLFVKLSLALFIAMSIDDKVFISRLHKLESKAMNLKLDNNKYWKYNIYNDKFEK